MPAGYGTRICFSSPGATGSGDSQRSSCRPGEDHGHPVMHRCDKGVRIAGDDGIGADRHSFGIVPLVVEPGKGEERVVRSAGNSRESSGSPHSSIQKNRSPGQGTGGLSAGTGRQAFSPRVSARALIRGFAARISFVQEGMSPHRMIASVVLPRPHNDRHLVPRGDIELRADTHHRVEYPEAVAEVVDADERVPAAHR